MIGADAMRAFGFPIREHDDLSWIAEQGGCFVLLEEGGLAVNARPAGSLRLDAVGVWRAGEAKPVVLASAAALKRWVRARVSPRLP
jgi:hypothetical protein